MIKQYIKQGDPRDAIDGVKALKKIEAKNEVIDQYVSEYKGLNMTYKLFKASSILYISGFDKVKGEKFAYANPQIMNAVSDIDINQQDFYEIAHDRYEADFRKYDELQAQSAAQQEPAMALSTESRRRQLRLTESELKQVVREAAMKIITEMAADPTINIQQLIQQANDAYHHALEVQGKTERWPLMDKDGTPYGLTGDIKLDGRGCVVIPFDGAYDVYTPEKIKVLTRAGGRIRINQGDYMNSGWKDAAKMLKQIIGDAQIGNGHFEKYDPNWESAETPEEYKANKEALRGMNKEIGRKASAGMDYLSKGY